MIALKTIPDDANPPIRLLMTAHQRLNPPEWIVQAPGREMWLAAAHGDDDEYTLYEADFDSRTTFSHRSAKTHQTVLKRPLPVWARYPAGVVAALNDNGTDIPGFQAVLLGDEPQGPRYDFGLGLVTAAFCHELVGAAYTAEQLVNFVERVRRDFLV